MKRLKKRSNDRVLDIARIGRHYKVRDEAVGISPKLTDVDKRNALFSQLAYKTDSENATKTKLSAAYTEWELTNVGNEASIFINRTEKKMVFAAKGTNPSTLNDLKSDFKLHYPSMRNWV